MSKGGKNILATILGASTAVLLLFAWDNLGSGLFARKSESESTPTNLVDIFTIAAENRDEALKGMYGGVETCARALSGRIKGQDTSAVRTHKWEMTASFSYQGGRGELTHPRLLSGSSWPPFFDEEAITCYVQRIEQTNLQIIERQDIALKIPFCVYPVFPEKNGADIDIITDQPGSLSGESNEK